MSESYRKTVAKLAEAAGSDPALLPCSHCKTPTSPATLADYSMCMVCFQAYCRAERGDAPLRYDTQTQRDMRARLTEHRNRTLAPVDKPAVLHEPPSSDDLARIAAAKAETQRKAAEYAAARGLDMTLKKPVLVDEASPMPPEPARFAEEDQA